MSIEGGSRRVQTPGGRRVFAAIVGFVIFVNAMRTFRPAVLFQPDLSWLVVWLGMWTVTLGAAVAGAAVAYRAFAWFEETQAARDPLEPLPFRRRTLAALTLAAVAAGTALRFADLAGRPPSSLLDDLTLIAPTLELNGSFRDFLRPLRAAPYGVEKPFATVGVLYLELSRWSLGLWGTTLTGIRFPAAFAGSLSILTGALLGRTLLPRGGGTLAALILAGLRWHLIVSSWSWAVAIVVVPLVDVATFLLVHAWRQRSLPLAAGAGLVCGLGAHAYLTAWVAGAALLLWVAMRAGDDEPARARLLRVAAFAGAFALVASPLFLPGSRDDPPYFARAGNHNVLSEIRYQKSVFPLFGAMADALAAPWFVPEPAPWADLPGRSRLGLILGVCLAVGFGRAFLKPRDELSGILLAHAVAAGVSAIAQGESGHPNGYRYVYLTVPAALGIASGLLALAGSAPERARRIAALAGVGAVAIAGTLGARDACLVWPQAHPTFTQFRGCGTLLGETAHRWSLRGPTKVDGELDGDLRIAAIIQRYALTRRPEPPPGGPPLFPSTFRVSLVPPRTLAPGERIVERVVTPWSEPCGVVVRTPRPRF
jgi:hypothetical protein